MINQKMLIDTKEISQRHKLLKEDVAELLLLLKINYYYSKVNNFNY